MHKSKYVDVKELRTITTKRKNQNTPISFRLKWQDLKADHAYFSKRGLLSETVATFGLGFVDCGPLKNRIAIPIHNEYGELVAYAGRWPGEPPTGISKYKFTHGFDISLELFNLIRAIHESPDQPLILVEDFFDCMNLWQYGVKRVVAVMNSVLSPAQVALINKYTFIADYSHMPQ